LKLLPLTAGKGGVEAVGATVLRVMM